MLNYQKETDLGLLNVRGGGANLTKKGLALVTLQWFSIVSKYLYRLKPGPQLPH